MMNHPLFIYRFFLFFRSQKSRNRARSLSPHSLAIIVVAVAVLWCWRAWMAERMEKAREPRIVNIPTHYLCSALIAQREITLHDFITLLCIPVYMEMTRSLARSRMYRTASAASNWKRSSSRWLCLCAVNPHRRARAHHTQARSSSPAVCWTSNHA
jgi:ABC-type nickel/cobalt efflux system permease component RcnA